MDQLIKAIVKEERVGLFLNGTFLLSSCSFANDGEAEVSRIVENMAEALRVVIVEIDIKQDENWDVIRAILEERGLIRRERYLN